jgi:hypothetical protein
MKRRRVLGLVAGTLLVSGTVVNAGQEPALESTLARRAAVLAARTNLGGASAPVLGTAAVRVVGVAWKSDDTPVEYPVLRIRNLQSGRVVARTRGTALGEFRFDRLEGGLYLIELLDDNDRVLAVGQPLAILPGEAVGTFLRLRADGSFDVGLFDGSAPTVVETAANAEVPAIGVRGRAASNEF